MNRLTYSVWMLLPLLGASLVHAQDAVFRCDSGNGVIEYRNNGNTKGCKKIETQAVMTIPGGTPKSAAPARPAGSSASASPSNFPQIDAATQKNRDGDRRRVLEQELRAEEQRLATLKSEYNGGQPERQGGERNYQKYLDRVEQLKNDVTRSQANIDALQREMSNLK